jgi:hypothetical protein
MASRAETAGTRQREETSLNYLSVIVALVAVLCTRGATAGAAQAPVKVEIVLADA